MRLLRRLEFTSDLRLVSEEWRVILRNNRANYGENINIIAPNARMKLYTNHD